jgi:hypothetical protein
MAEELACIEENMTWALVDLPQTDWAEMGL